MLSTAIRFLLPALAGPLLVSGQSVLLETSFDSPSLVGWTQFRTGTEVQVVPYRNALMGKRSPSPGLVALTRELPSPQNRIQVEFSFAFGGSDPKGRSLNVWTHEPDGTDASQFNLCVQGGALRQYDGRTRSWEVISRRIQSSPGPEEPVWHRLRATIDAESGGIDFWLSPPGSEKLPPKVTATLAAYRTNLPLGAVDFVSGTRIAEGNWYLIDDLIIRAGVDLPRPGEPLPLPETFPLWSGPPLPGDPSALPFVSGLRHTTLHQAIAGTYQFLHGAAILEHEGVFYANWANSPVNENGPHETLQGRRSLDGTESWTPPEMIGPGFEGPERHSHGILFVHQGEVWTICARFGVGEPAKKFDGLQGEAFVLNPSSGIWESRGIVMKNCWPYDQPVAVADGSLITGGQDKDGLPVVAISRGTDLSQWDSVLIPFHPQLAPSFAETTVWADGDEVLAVIRGGGGVAWVATSSDGGRSWERARPSNLPMPRAKAYLGRLSTGELYLISNYRNRDTLVLSLGEPGAKTLSRMWRLRHGRSEPPRFPGSAKSKQWSYPYAYEHQDHLYVVYSIGKEDCGLTVVPLENLR